MVFFYVVRVRLKDDDESRSPVMSRFIEIICPGAADKQNSKLKKLV